MIIPVFIPVTEEEMEAMSIDITDLPTGKQILLFFLTLIPVWAVVAWLWSTFLCDRPFFTDYLLFTNMTFSFLVALLFNLFFWFTVDAFVIDWINQIVANLHRRKRRRR